MATLDTISIVTRITVPLPRGVFEERKFYALPSFMNDMRNVIPNLPAGRLNAPMTPREQLDDILLRWNSGQPMHYGRWLKDLVPREAETWELKTADLRIFGWTYRPKIFVAVFIGYADNYKRHKGRPPQESYDDARDRVLRSRDRLNVDEPKFAGGDFHALI